VSREIQRRLRRIEKAISGPPGIKYVIGDEPYDDEFWARLDAAEGRKAPETTETALAAQHSEPHAE
jgi:hypothetical protein